MEKTQKLISVAAFLQDCVDVPRFEACCRACPGYGKTWSCPPFRFDPTALWMKYDSLLLQSRKIPVPEELLEKHFSSDEINAASEQLVRTEKYAMLTELLELEKQHPGSMALSGGSCDLCPAGTCTRLLQETCRNPHMMRYSIESLGGDVGKALSLYLDQQIQWGKDGRMPEYYILLGGLLLKHPAAETKEREHRL